MAPRKIRRTSLRNGPADPLFSPENKVNVPLIQRAEHLATISAQYSDGTAVAELPVGPYTYKALQIAIESDAAIVGETINVGGREYVQTAFLSKYIDRITLEIDGTAERDIDVATFLQLNSFMGFDATDGLAYMTFGVNEFPFQPMAEDAYMLGTGNLRSVRLLFKLATPWVDGSMNLRVLCEHARLRRPLGFITTMKSYRYSLASIGEHTITDLPINADIARLFVFGDGLKDTELRIDDQLIFDANSYEMQGLNALYGRDIAALGNGILFDFWRERDVNKGVASLTTAAERKRNADVRLQVETTAANTEVRVLMQLCGRYWSQS